jgi:2-oxoglutarate ferredoxin oxidoreductase subunit beta
MNAFGRALLDSKLNLDKVAVVSGIGCTGRVAGHTKLDSFHTTHGRAIPFATGLKLANPELTVVVYSGDGDLFAIGGNHILHAARRNVDIKVVCVNNFTYGMTGGQSGPTTPLGSLSATSAYGTYDPPFNLPALMDAAGACWVARWTTYHVLQMERSMKEMLAKPGFAFMEVVSPCPVLFQRKNKMGDGVDSFKHYKEHSKIRNGAASTEAQLDWGGEITVGKFVDRDRPTYIGLMREKLHDALGDEFINEGVPSCCDCGE